MTLGTIYYNQASPRSTWLIPLAKYLGVAIDSKTPDAPEFASLFPLKKTPAFSSENGFKLVEMIAIAYYLVQKSEKKELNGTTDEEKATNLKWLSFVNSEILGSAYSLHAASSDEEKFKAFEKFKGNMTFIDEQLSETKFLNGKTPLLSDMYAFTMLSAMKSYQLEFNSFPNITRYYEEVESLPIGKSLETK